MESMIEGTGFGIIDNAVLLIGAYTGLEIERFLPLKRVGIGAVLGAGIGNAVSDLLAGFVVDPVFAFGTFVGCMVALVFTVAVVEHWKREIST